MLYSRTTLRELVHQDGCQGVSVCRILESIGGPDDLISPPTYAQPKNEEKAPRYVTSKRRDEHGRELEVILLDSPASQANRMEEGLLELLRSKRIHLPVHELQVPELGVLTDLEMPHRVYDATIQTATVKGTDKSYKQSAVCKAIRSSSRKDATGLIEHAPLVLVFGGWDSHSDVRTDSWQGRYEKAIWSKIIAIDTNRMERPGGRLDPLGLPSEDRVDLGRGRKALSSQGLGTVPASVGPNNRISVTMDHAEQRSVLSLGALRRLGFGSEERNTAARTYLAALGMLAIEMLHQHGKHLRSECSLVDVAGEANSRWRLRPGDEELEGVTVDACIQTLTDAEKGLEAAGFTVRQNPIQLTVHTNITKARKTATKKATQDRKSQEKESQDRKSQEEG